MINISFCYDAKGETYEIHVRFIGQYGSHEFEYAVADLLRHNGFREVQVTQASNDYGIDILAKRKNTSADFASPVCVFRLNRCEHIALPVYGYGSSV